MKINLVSSFLFALLITAGLAVPTLDQIWEVDESCNEVRHALNTSFSAVREMVKAARRDLFRIQEKKLRRKISGPLNSTNWDRIARNMAVTFGLEPPTDPYQNGYDTGNEHFQQVNYTIGRLWGGIVQGDALPERGFSKKLRQLDKKPLIICNDTVWTYRDREMSDLYDPTKNIMEVFPKVNERRPERSFIYEGAWIHKNRYIAGGDIGGPQICSGGIYAVTMQSLDMITFCDDVFKFNPNQSAVHNASDIKLGTNIDRSGIATHSLARVMLHEFAHYYGTKAPADEEEGLLDSDKLSDKYGVDRNGCPVYFQPAMNGRRGRYVKENPGGLKGVKVYGMAFVANIARNQIGNARYGFFQRDSTRPDDWTPCVNATTGQSAAPYTAETYAYFSILSYLDQWDLTPDGVAKTLPV